MAVPRFDSKQSYCLIFKSQSKVKPGTDHLKHFQSWQNTQNGLNYAEMSFSKTINPSIPSVSQDEVKTKRQQNGEPGKIMIN